MRSDCRCILNCSMSVARARLVEGAIDPNEPWHTRCEFLESLAALTAIHKAEVARKVTGANKPLYKLLWSAGAPARIEWLWNSMRMRATLAPHELSLLPSGTTSNESLHAEINNWFRQTQEIHQATLRLKLSILEMAKLLPHNSAAYRPTLRQLPPGYVLARAAVTEVWSDAAWGVWCCELSGGASVAKAQIPLQEQRMEQARAVRAWRLGRPAAASIRRPAAAQPIERKRTPFTVRRGGEFVTGGVKRAISKRPAACLHRPAAATRM